jgi:hypothetical protein
MLKQILSSTLSFEACSIAIKVRVRSPTTPKCSRLTVVILEYSQIDFCRGSNLVWGWPNKDWRLTNTFSLPTLMARLYVVQITNQHSHILTASVLIPIPGP